MILRLFMTTVKEYKRFTDELPVNHEVVVNDVLTNKDYVYENVRLMLLRKYFQKSNTGGDVCIPNVIAQAKLDYPRDEIELDDLLNDYKSSCEPALKHILSDGTERTLLDSINDIIYGLYLHGDKDKIEHLCIDDENIRNYCIVLFVKEIERVLFKLYGILDKNGVKAIEHESHISAPVLSFNSDTDNNEHITGSPYWSNLKGKELDETNIVEYYRQFLNNGDSTDVLVWVTAYAFTRLLADDTSSINSLREMVCKSSMISWGDFSKAREAWKEIDSPGFSSKVRYNDNKDEAYVHIFPNVIEGFAVESKYLVPNVYKIVLRKEKSTSEWKVFSFVGELLK